MKKVYAKLAGSKMRFFRLFYKASFVKMLSLSSIVALLSSVSPVYSKTVASKEAFLISAKSPAVAFPQRVISIYDYYNDDTSDQENYVTALKVVGNTLAANAVSDYAHFLTTAFSRKNNDNAVVNILTAYDNGLSKNKPSAEEQYKRSLTSQQFSIPDNSISQRLAQNNDEATLVGRAVNNAGRVVNIQSRDINQGWYGLTDRATVWMGQNIDSSGDRAVILGVGAKYNILRGRMRTGAVIIGGLAKVEEVGYAIAIGYEAHATEESSMALGYGAVVSKENAVALGAASKANVAAGISGYNPKINAAVKEGNHVWKSTLGAVSIGDVADKKTRQIVGVAAGSADTDAVNVAQLKALRTAVDKGWKLSVDGKHSIDVGMGEEIDFSAGSSNFTITKGDKNSNIKFDLAKDLVLDSVKAGSGTLDATGLVIKDGPKILTTGIEVGNKKITGVAKGTGANDAVNFSQLEEIKEQVA
ncbi:hypothetical protein MCO_01829, partial [Bartonella sp. DB5-6]